MLRKIISLSIAIVGLVFLLSSCCFFHSRETPTSENEYGYLHLKFKLPPDFTVSKPERYIPSNSEKIRIAIFNPDIDGQSFKYVEDIDLSGQGETVERNLKLRAVDNYLIGVAALKDVDSNFESVYCSNAAAILSFDLSTFKIEPAKNSTVQLTLKVPQATVTTVQMPSGPSEKYSATLTVENVNFELLNLFGFDVTKAFYYFDADPLNKNILMHTSAYDFPQIFRSTNSATFSNLNLYTPTDYNGVLYCQFGFELGDLFDNPNAGGIENAWLLFPEINSTLTGYVLSDYGSITIIIE